MRADDLRAAPPRFAPPKASPASAVGLDAVEAPGAHGAAIYIDEIRAAHNLQVEGAE